MNDLPSAIIELKSDFVAEVLDTANVNLFWTSRHLQDGRHSQAIVAFNKMVVAVRAAAVEMAAIRSIVDGKQLTGSAAEEYRRDRDRRRPATKPSEAVP